MRLAFAVDLPHSQPHRDTHKKRLWQFNARATDMQKVAVIERLKSEIVELEIALRLQRRSKT